MNFSEYSKVTLSQIIFDLSDARWGTLIPNQISWYDANDNMIYCIYRSCLITFCYLFFIHSQTKVFEKNDGKN